MEENDFQIKGFPVRLPLDIFVIATANPEDYTNRGRIITPLKDRFDVQLRTHYPKKIQHEIEIMEQEYLPTSIEGFEIKVPHFIKEILAELTFQARTSTDINQHSGVSCRISIRSYETIIGSSIRRCLELGEDMAVPRITDIETTFPAVIGKLEIEYEVPDTNTDEIIENFAKRAIKIVFDSYFKLDELKDIVSAFQKGISAEVSRFQPSKLYVDGMKNISGINTAVKKLIDLKNAPEVASAYEFVLEGLHLSNKLNRVALEKGMVYNK